jgi:hypothetical protein
LENASDVMSHQCDSHVSDFYGTAIECVTEWIYTFNGLMCMSGVTLRKSRILEDVHKSLEFMVKEKIVLSESFDETGLFDEYCSVSKYVEGEIWNLE